MAPNPFSSARARAEAIVCNERDDLRGDLLADIPAERWTLAIERMGLGVRIGRGRPRAEDVRLTRDEILARLLDGEDVARRAGTSRSKNIRDARTRATRRQKKN